MSTSVAGQRWWTSLTRPVVALISAFALALAAGLAALVIHLLGPTPEVYAQLSKPTVDPQVSLPIYNRQRIGSLSFAEDHLVKNANVTSFQPFAAGAVADGPGTRALEGQLRSEFHGMRTLTIKSSRTTMVLVGAVVNFDLTLTGLRGKSTYLSWSLHPAQPEVHVPSAWVRERPVIRLVAQADKDGDSGDFWIPVPKARGPYFVRIVLRNDHGGRLDYVDTKPFR